MLWLLLSVGLLFICLPAFAQDHVVQSLEQSFYFDWNIPTQPVPIPTTAQCDVIHISWNRGDAKGPNPTAPYYLQIYTSTFIVPFVVDAGSGLEFNWTVPFVPGTQYQICMFDSKGNTGGCQAVYTVYPATGATIENPPVCTNLTYPATPLEVEGTVSNGPLSQYGWVDQCTDLSLTPKSGVPPYTMTIAPALHPPFNITSSTQDPLIWSVSLSYGAPFFVSLVDSTGLVWSNGPLHSGANGPTGCLSLSGNRILPSVAVGSGVGGLVLGALLGILSAWFFTRRKYGQVSTNGSRVSLDAGPFALTGNTQYDPVSSMNSSSNRRPDDHNGAMSQYNIEPFSLTLGNDTPHRPPLSPPTSEPSESQSGPSSQSNQRSHVYVVHHDAGGAPVTVYTDGADVVELPPTYARQRNADSPGGLDPPRRAAGPLPRKGSRQQIGESS